MMVIDSGIGNSGGFRFLGNGERERKKMQL